MEEMPVYVKIDDERVMHEIISDLRELISMAHHTMERIDDLSHKESLKIHEWETLFDDVTHKISSVSEMLHDPARI